MAPPRAPVPGPAKDYFLCGWRVRSALAIPEAMPWVGDDRAPDVSIHIGAVPPLTDPIFKGSGPVQIGHDGTCRLAINGIGAFHVIGGREVIAAPSGDVERPEFQGWLLGAVVGMLCHQRGQFPLHAACVRIGDGAVALSGRPGAGKSTLAAALVRRGHALIADDVCVLDAEARDGPVALPSFPRVKLWEDSLRALDISASGVRRSDAGKRKFHFCEVGRFDPTPVRLRAIYFLVRSGRMEPQDVSAKSGPEAAAMLSNEIYRRPIGFHLGRKRALLTGVMQIVAAVPVFHLSVRADLGELESSAAGLEAHFASLKRNPDSAGT